MAHGRGALGGRADHEAGRIAEEQQGQGEGVAHADEARRLVGAVGVDRAAEMRRVVGEDPKRPAVAEGQRRDHPRPEAAAQLEHRALVEERLDHAAHVIDPLALLGDQLRRRLWSGTAPGVLGPRK